MTSLATKRTCSKVSRSVKVLIPLATEPSVGVVRVTEGKRVEDYCLWRQPAEAEGDRGYRLTKLNDPSHDGYDVLLSGLVGQCECKGFHFRGKCRHISLCEALEAAGKV